MARLTRAKQDGVQQKVLRIPKDIRYLLIANLVLNLVILYALKFS